MSPFLEGYLVGSVVTSLGCIVLPLFFRWRAYKNDGTYIARTVEELREQYPNVSIEVTSIEDAKNSKVSLTVKKKDIQ